MNGSHEQSCVQSGLMFVIQAPLRQPHGRCQADHVATCMLTCELFLSA